jgi:hypothetical protein
MNKLRNESCKQGHKLMEGFLDGPHDKCPRGIFGYKDTWMLVRSNFGLNSKKQKVWLEQFAGTHQLAACVPNFSSWLLERRITCVDHVCLCRLTPSQTEGPDFFLKCCNHHVLCEFCSMCKMNIETNQFHGGANLNDVVPHPDLCTCPENPQNHIMTVFPGRGAAVRPNYHDMSSVTCSEEQIDWTLGKDMQKILTLILDPDVFHGGSPFCSFTCGLELNNFDNRQICHLPIKEHGNSIVQDAAPVDRLGACDLCTSPAHCALTVHCF